MSQRRARRECSSGEEASEGDSDGGWEGGWEGSCEGGAEGDSEGGSESGRLRVTSGRDELRDARRIRLDAVGR